MSANASSKQCPRCGATYNPAGAEGLCPRCLVAMNLESPTEAFESGNSSATEVVPRPPAPPPSVAEIAPHFPQLEILECLGRGGMGVLYRARQPRLNRMVALKILAPEKQDAAFAERFTREAQALARLNHPNIVIIHDFGNVGRLFYLVMEFVEGVSLRQLLESKKLTPEEALAIVPQICSALQYAHQRGIVHRDIKPENVLIDREGQVKIADFGIAKMLGQEHPQAAITQEQQVIGTPHYMAPEQAEHPERVDHRADIFSLGVVFYEMLTGELPLGKFAPPSSRMGGVSIDVRLDEVVLKALEKEPERRYQQAGQLKTEVETIAATPAAHPTPKPRSMKPTARIGLIAAALALILVLPFALYLTRSSGNANRLAQEGWQLWQAQQWDAAIAKFQAALKRSPNDANTWNGLGWASLNSGKQAQAEQAFQKAVTLDPAHPAALNGLGQLYLQRKEFDRAEAYLLKAAPKAPAAWFGLARLYLIQGKFDQAEVWARKLVDSGQAGELAQRMLDAAQSKRLSDGLRVMIEPR